MTNASLQPTPYSWFKVLVWSFLFYVVWHWQNMLLVYNEGVLPGPDDFLRLHQVQNWILGQGWFDLTAYRIFPNVGADIHWSRFVDVPIASLIIFFNVFTDFETSSRLASISWPLILFLLSIIFMVAICDRLIGKQYRMLVIFFFVLLIDTMVEFRPGRIDHHNIQIFLLIIIMFALSKGGGKFLNYILGATIPLTLVIGLDLVIFVFAVLGFIAFNWALGNNGSVKRLKETGMAIGIFSLIFYTLSFRPEHWLSNNACDAYSGFYVSALVLLSIGFILLALLSNLNLFSFKNTFVSRLILGAIVACVIIVTIFYIYPSCLEGPYGNVTPELQSRWLDKVLEAKGLFERIHFDTVYWSAQTVYLTIVSLVMGWVLIKRVNQIPELMVLGFIVSVCVIGAFYQTRIIRTGIYTVIPFCVIFASMTWEFLSQKFKNNSFAKYLIQSVICISLTSFFWTTMTVIISASLLSENTQAKTKTNKAEAPKVVACTSEQVMVELKQLKKGHVLSDLNTSTALLVHTHHSVEGASYHRNAESILNVFDFLEGGIEEAKNIADNRSADYVVICRKPFLNQKNDALSLLYAIGENKLPEWLQWVSKPNASLAVLKIVR